MKNGTGDAPFELSDLKSLLNAAMLRRAEAALPQVRSIVKKFKERVREKPLSAAALAPQADEEEIRLILFKLNPASQIKKISSSQIRFRAPRLYKVPGSLPAGYGYKGGVARLGLRVLLGEKLAKARPRDIDLVRLGPGSRKADDELSARLMPEDFSHGHSVEVVPSLEQYFLTRDLTINEVLITGGELICSREALSDTIAGIVRPSAFALKGMEHPRALTLLKMLRFYAEGRAAGRNCRLAGVPEEFKAKPFEVALHLKRVLEAGKEAAELYVSELLRHRVIEAPAGQSCLDELAVRLLKGLGRVGSEGPRARTTAIRKPRL